MGRNLERSAAVPHPGVWKAVRLIRLAAFAARALAEDVILSFCQELAPGWGPSLESALQSLVINTGDEASDPELVGTEKSFA